MPTPPLKGLSPTGLPVVGMVGGGQLARMTHQAAIGPGMSLRVLAERPDDSAAVVAHDVELGHPDDLEALCRFAAGCDVVTFDHEHVPEVHLRALVDAGHQVHPGPDALRHAQDKVVMRSRLTELGVACPRWALTDVAGLAVAAAELGWPLIVKSPRGGYDGRGVWRLDDPAALQRFAADAPGGPLLAEELVPLRRELSVVLARSPFGQAAAYPVVETVQQDGICVEVLAPAPELPPDLAVQAESLALRLAGELGVVGVLAVELFETHGGELLVNELAMRPHNSGHWTLDGARTSQFEQHLRAVADYPLGATAMTAPWAVMVNVLGGEPGGVGLDQRLHHVFAADPAVRVHVYGKTTRPGRKIGHVTAVGDDLDDVRRRARDAAAFLQEGASVARAAGP